MSQILKSGGGGGVGTLTSVTVTNGTPNFILTGTTEDINYGVTNIVLGSSLPSLTTGSVNVGLGFEVLKGTTSALYNTAIGYQSLTSVTSGGSCVGIGRSSLSKFTTGATNQGSNIAVGVACARDLTSGILNTFVGTGSAIFMTTGSYNTILGNVGSARSGFAYTSSESSNIVIGNTGVVSESNVIRIGTTGGGNGQQNLCYIAGAMNFGTSTATETHDLSTGAGVKIVKLGSTNTTSKTTINAGTGGWFTTGVRGVTTVNADAIAVLIDSAGQLGTVSSSARVKDNIHDMGTISDDIFSLRPVVFNYKSHAPESKSLGLIAEEVAEVMPKLVVYDKESLPETVKYQDLVPMLLNEVQKLRKELNALKGY